MKVVSGAALLALASPTKGFMTESRSPAFSRNLNSALASTQQDTTGSSYEDALSSYAGAPGSPRPGPPPMAEAASRSAPTRESRPAVDMPPPLTIQGGSLKTWSLQSSAVERVEVVLGTEGRPLDADIDLWHGPDNTPNKMRVYVEDGAKRPFHAVIETPRGPNTLAVRNIGQLEFPLEAQIMPNPMDNAYSASDREGMDGGIIQGGALKTFSFESQVDSVQIMLKTDGRPLNARIELLQGPNNIKQVMEMYIEDGMDRPFYAILKTPGSGNVVRIVNTSTMEFPLTAALDAYELGDFDLNSDIVVGGDGSEFNGKRDLQW